MPLVSLFFNKLAQEIIFMYEESTSEKERTIFEIGLFASKNCILITVARESYMSRY